MAMENITNEQTGTAWVIDMDWYEKNHRSFYELAHNSLCSKCVEKLGKKKKKTTESDILAAIKDCCAQTPEYVTARMPLMESVFRIIIGNGNQPMSVSEISKQLNERRGGNAYVTEPALLTRVLSNDKWYGFKLAA